MNSIRVDELAGVAVQLVGRVRDERPDAVGVWLAAQVPDPHDWWALCFLLAAAVPADEPWTNLTAWARLRDLARGDAPTVLADRRRVLNEAMGEAA